MKYVDEFRDGATAQGIAEAIAAEILPDRTYRIMEFCGGHTHAISRFGLEDLLPPAIRLIHGPGCPVCVLPTGRIEMAIELAKRPGVALCTYGDMLRVPGSGGGSLLKARAQGATVRMVYSPSDAVDYAKAHPDIQVVFFAIGFETTTPPTAMVIKDAMRLGLDNFTVFCNHVLTPPAIAHILDQGEVQLDGFIGPAHVSAIIGSLPYQQFIDTYAKPVVVAGFEPLDVLQAVRMLVRQLNAGTALVENEYSRAAKPEGNRKAQALVAEVFDLRPEFEWRGLGRLPYSALRLKPEFAWFDAENRFGLTEISIADHKACECGAILRGLKRPQDCKVFGTACTPETPLGSCMVSAEGACAAHWTYGRFRDHPRPEAAQ